jgi:hypothetical protein
MAKEDKKKVKTNAHSSSKYVTSDDDDTYSDDNESLLSEFCKKS